ncbi:MAG: hypothetical protein ACI4PT_06800 [Candidatus Avoscillospira sp.]
MMIVSPLLIYFIAGANQGAKYLKITNFSVGAAYMPPVWQLAPECSRFRRDAYMRPLQEKKHVFQKSEALI